MIYKVRIILNMKETRMHTITMYKAASMIYKVRVILNMKEKMMHTITMYFDYRSLA